MVMPFWYSQTRIKPGAAKGQGSAEVTARHNRFWPLYTYKREGDRSKFGMPALCPFREVDAIERNYAPLWTIYARQRNGSLVEDDVLWGLFRYRRGPEEKNVELFPSSEGLELQRPNGSWSLLKGLSRVKNAAKKPVLHCCMYSVGARERRRGHGATQP